MALRGFRRRRSLWGTLVLLAMALLALAPAQPRLHVAYDPLAWVPVCTAAGLVHTQWQPDGTPMPNPAERAMQVDAVCHVLQAHAHPLPSAEVVLPLPARPGAWHARQHGTPAPQPLLWARAQPRAPPLA